MRDEERLYLFHHRRLLLQFDENHPDQKVSKASPSQPKPYRGILVPMFTNVIDLNTDDETDATPIFSKPLPLPISVDWEEEEEQVSQMGGSGSRYDPSAEVVITNEKGIDDDIPKKKKRPRELDRLQTFGSPWVREEGHGIERPKVERTPYRPFAKSSKPAKPAKPAIPRRARTEEDRIHIGPMFQEEDLPEATGQTNTPDYSVRFRPESPVPLDDFHVCIAQRYFALPLEARQSILKDFELLLNVKENEIDRDE